MASANANAITTAAPTEHGPPRTGRWGVGARLERTWMPIDSRSRSFTRPTPGTLRMERSCVNALIARGVNSSLNCPFGLFCGWARRHYLAFIPH